MSLHLYDSKTARLQPLNPVVPGHVGIYLCGATVQGSPHVGHLRSAVAFDSLIRWLKRSGLEVTYIRNVTDIDDKILRKSTEAGVPWWAWAQRYEREFTEAYHKLGVLDPTYEPRATGHIPEQIALIQRLVDRGHAYSDGAGNVYFSVASQKDYGSLTHQRLEDMRTTEDESQIDSVTEAGKK
ncbi:MAG: class I tRNA ligase family protein, partial [Actinomyces sp.]|nr:class I tRNA ligase family protein [Actinomyces sp.]